MRPNDNTDRENQEILDTGEATDPTELSKLHADKILLKPQHAGASKIYQEGKIVNFIKEYKKVVRDKNEKFIVDGTATGVDVTNFSL